MSTPIPRTLDSLPLHQAADYYHHLQYMQGLLRRHRRCQVILVAGFFATIIGFAYEPTDPIPGFNLLTDLLLLAIPLLLIVLPSRLQENAHRDIAVLLRDLPLPDDANPPSVKEISRLLQSATDFDHTLRTWLDLEINRCIAYGPPSK